MKRQTVFVVQMAWIVILGVLAGLQVSELELWVSKIGSIPVGVVWFGALGAVLTSLNGIIDHPHDWDSKYDLWHLARPLIGAAVAVVAVLMLQAGVLAVGVTPAGSEMSSGERRPGPEGDYKNLLYYLMGFLVGYREETFRELMKKLVDLFLAPGAGKPAPSVTEVTCLKADDKKVPAVISGAGLTGATSVMFGSRPADFQVDSDARITAVLPDGTALGPVLVTVKTTGGTATTTFTRAPDAFTPAPS